MNRYTGGCILCFLPTSRALASPHRESEAHNARAVGRRLAPRALAYVFFPRAPSRAPSVVSFIVGIHVIFLEAD